MIYFELSINKDVIKKDCIKLPITSLCVNLFAGMHPTLSPGRGDLYRLILSDSEPGVCLMND